MEYCLYTDNSAQNGGAHKLHRSATLPRTNPNHTYPGSLRLCSHVVPGSVVRYSISLNYHQKCSLAFTLGIFGPGKIAHISKFGTC